METHERVQKAEVLTRSPAQQAPRPELPAGHPTLRLQRAVGNRIVQAKLNRKAVSSVEDSSFPGIPSVIGDMPSVPEQSPDAAAPVQLPVFSASRQASSAVPERSNDSLSSGLLQRKLTIGASNDPLEQEADRIAELVMRMPEPADLTGEVIDRSGEDSGISRATPRIQRFSGDPTGQSDAAPASVDQALASPSTPLDPTLRKDMERRFSYDFSQVRVHSDTLAEQSARDVSATAYTVGHDIVFGAGRYAPETHRGRLLIAHELTHVMQQRESMHTVQREQTTGALGAGGAGPESQTGSGGHRGMGSASEEDRQRQREPSSGPPESYSTVKEALYRNIIRDLRSVQKRAFDHLRSRVEGKSLSPFTKPLLKTLIGIFEEFVGCLITVLLTVIGILVGMGEAVVGMIIGIAKLILGVIKWFALYVDYLIGHPQRFVAYNQQIIDAAKNIVPALVTYTNDWLDRFRKAPIDRATIMIGELTGHIMIFVATLGAASAKVGQIPRLSVELAEPIKFVTPTGQVFAVPAGAVSINVASPALAASTVAVVGTMSSGGKLPSKLKSPRQPIKLLKKGSDSDMTVLQKRVLNKREALLKQYGDDSWGRNIASAKVKVDGKVRRWTEVNDVGGLHSEAKILNRIEELRKAGRKVEGIQVYSERIPCYESACRPACMDEFSTVGYHIADPIKYDAKGLARNSDALKILYGLNP